MHLHLIGLHVHMCVLDGASENRAFVKMQVLREDDSRKTSDDFVRAYTTNPFSGRRLWFMSDPPHGKAVLFDI